MFRDRPPIVRNGWSSRIGGWSAAQIGLLVVAVWALQPVHAQTQSAASPADGCWAGRSPIAEPYPYLHGGHFSGPPVATSPDPLVTYRWPDPKAGDGLEIYTRRPVAVKANPPGAFVHVGSLLGSHPNVTIRSPGSIRFDFGRENAAWLEFDSPDLNGDVEMSISEYNEPAVENAGAQHRIKTRTPTRYGHTYRLELNNELYEGVRFGWLHVRSLTRPWHLTGLRLVCQAKPANYDGRFSCSDPELTRIWYAGAYTVRLNLLHHYFGAILMERSDRFSWTGDAHTSQAAALVAFGNDDFIRENLVRTATQSNGIASYALYWVLSLTDYYDYTGDDATLARFIPNACTKLDAADAHFGHPPNLAFYGWDERLGAGFENPNIPEAKHAYAMLSIRAWRAFARAMGEHGRPDLQAKYLADAKQAVATLRRNPAWDASYGIHAAAGAVNAGVATPAEQRDLFARDFSDRVTRLSYSPFNEFFIIQAMARMGHFDAALGAIRDDWGGQLRYGGTTFFEVYDPSWNRVLGPNGAPPNNQCGYTSLCHPWSAGVVKWLTEETLGIHPTTPGFRTYAITPHLGRTLTWVAGRVPTPHGPLAARFNVTTGQDDVQAPPDTVGEIAIPKVERTIRHVTINGHLAWDGSHFHPVLGIGDARDVPGFVQFSGVQPGHYRFAVTYSGTTPAPIELPWCYPAKLVKEDATTHGNWGGVYGADGYVLCNDLGDGRDLRRLPAYVASVRYTKNAATVWAKAVHDPRALAPDAANGFPRNAATIYTQDPRACFQTMTVDIQLTHPRPYRVALYFLDWDRRGRRLAVEMFDRRTLHRIAPVEIVRDFAGGKYLVYAYDRSARFRIDQVRGPNATLSGLFFDSH